jgi:putative aldouronate transport system substrate-binding protein
LAVKSIKGIPLCGDNNEVSSSIIKGGVYNVEARKMTVKLAMSITLLSVVLTGCSDSEENDKVIVDNTDNTVQEGKAETQNYTLPLVKDGTATLTVGVADNYYAPKSYAENLPVWKEIEKKTGVKINWDVNSSNQYNSVMRIRMAAANGLPDIVQLPDSPVEYGKDGLIISLTDLIDKYAPNIKRFMEQNPDIYNLLKSPDGKVYALSSVVSGTAYTDPNGLLLRKDWLDKLGLQEPTTLDEWYTVLKAFKEKDPNGNGKADEIPFSPQYSWGGVAEVFGHALGLHLAGYCRGYHVDENGKVHYGWMDPKAEKLIVWLNKLYKEGLIDSEFMTKKSDRILSDISRELVGSTNHLLNSTAKFNAAVGTKEVNWILALPPGESDETRFYEKFGPISTYFGISKDAKNPELAIKWLDYIYASEEGARMLAFGIEGLSYTMVEGKPEFTQFVSNNPNGLDPTNALRSIGAFPTLPWIRSSEGPFSLQPTAMLNLDPAMVKQAKRVEPFMIEALPLRFILATEDEVDEEKRLEMNINTYVEETILKFIYGAEPIEWAKFMEKLNKLGINDLLAIKQKQYDRYMK